jgi:type I restriction enzyme R subunit
MSSPELDKVELPALEQLQALGWQYLEGAKLSPEESDERDSYKEVVLEKRLSLSIKRINPWISGENLHKVVRDIMRTPFANLIEANAGSMGGAEQVRVRDAGLGQGEQGADGTDH